MNKLTSKALLLFLSLTLFWGIEAQAQPQTNFKAQDIGKPAIKGDAQIVTDGVDSRLSYVLCFEIRLWLSLSFNSPKEGQ